MNTKCYNYSTLKFKLRDMKERGKKDVIWALNLDQLDFIVGLGYKVEPYLYRIHTKTFPAILPETNPLIKEIHFKRKSGTATYVRKLRKKDLRVLDENDVRYGVCKYRIILN